LFGKGGYLPDAIFYITTEFDLTGKVWLTHVDKQINIVCSCRPYYKQTTNPDQVVYCVANDII